MGLLNTSGFHAQAGAALDHDGTLAMKATVAGADAPDDSISWLAPPATRQLLEGREKVSNTARYIWEDDVVASRPARVSTDVPSATLIAGAWSEALVAFWGTGIELAINPFDPNGFKIGRIQARVVVDMDVGFSHIDAFSVATGVNY